MRMGPTYTMRDANVMSTRASCNVGNDRSGRGGAGPPGARWRGPHATSSHRAAALTSAAAAGRGGRGGRARGHMPAPVPAAISRATLGSALGVDNNAGGMNGIKVAHAMPLHIGGGEMVQQHTRRRRRPAGPAPRTGDRGPAYPSLAVSAVPVAASAPAASAVPVAAPAPNRECAARHAIP